MVRSNHAWLSIREGCANFARALGVVTIVFFVVFSLLEPFSSAHAATPQTINTQIRLKTAGGVAVTTAVPLQFSLYSVPSGGLPTDTATATGTLLWKEVYDGSTVPCSMITPDSEGYFSVSLGSCTAFPSYLTFNTTSLYLGVKVSADPEMTPRLAFSSAPFALNAETVNGFGASATASPGKLLALSSTLGFDIGVGVFGGGSLSLSSTTAQNLIAGSLTVAGTTTLASTSVQNLTINNTTTFGGAAVLTGFTSSTFLYVGSNGAITQNGNITWNTPSTTLNLNGSLELASTTLLTTTDRLYNQGGTLYWNGSAIGTASSAFYTNLTWTNATSTNFFTTNAFSTNASTTNLTSQNLITQNATSTNLTATNATSTNLFSTNSEFINQNVVNSTSTNQFTTNLTATNATSTNQFVTNLSATNATSTNQFTTNLTTTNATSTNLFSTNSEFINQNVVNGTTTNQFVSNLTATNATSTNQFVTNLSATNATSTNQFTTNLNTTNATSTNLAATNAFLTTVIMGSASSTNFFATNLSATNATSTNQFVTNLSATNATSTNQFTTNLTTTNATSTNLFSTNSEFINQNVVNGTTTNQFVSNLTATNATSTNQFATNFTSTNATSTNLFATNLTATNATSTNQFVTNLATTNGTSTNFFATNLTATAISAGLFDATNLLWINATGTNSFVTNATNTNLFATNLVANNGQFTNITSTRITSTDFQSTNGTIANLLTTNVTSTNVTTTNLFLTGLTAGSVLFIGSTGAVTQNNNFFWDNTNGRLGVGTSTPAAKLSVSATGTQDLFDVSSSTGGSVLTVKADGKVGIGTSSPRQTLDVVGGVLNLLSPFTRITTNTTALSGTDGGRALKMGNYIYITHRNTGVQGDLSVVDVTNPTSPVFVASTTVGPFGGIPVDITGVGNYVFVANSNTTTISAVNVSNPKQPYEVSQLVIGQGPRSLVAKGKYLYVIQPGTPSLLNVVDISNPANMRVAATTSIGANFGVSGMYVQGRYVYTRNNDANTMSIIDISDPYSPTLTATTSGVGSGSGGIFVSGRYAYLAANSSNLLTVVDVTNPAAPVPVASTTVATYSDDVEVSGRYAYVTGYFNGEVSIVDVSNPLSPSLIMTKPVGSNPYEVMSSGKYLYILNAITPVSLTTVDLGGIEAANVFAHAAEVGSLTARNDVNVQGQIRSESLQIGQNGISSFGALAIQSTSSRSSIAGFTSLGELSPAVKIGYFTGTTPGTVNNCSTVTLTDIDATKIIDLNVLVEWSANGAYMSLNNSALTGYEWYWYSGNGVSPSVFVCLTAGNSGNMVNQPIKIVVVYTP